MKRSLTALESAWLRDTSHDRECQNMTRALEPLVRDALVLPADARNRYFVTGQYPAIYFSSNGDARQNLIDALTDFVERVRAALDNTKPAPRKGRPKSLRLAATA